MKNSFKVHELWPKPIFDTDIPVTQNVIDYAHNSEYVRMEVGNGDYTSNKYVLNDLIDLRNILMKNVYLFTEKYLKIIDTEFYLLNSWIVRHHPKDWSQPHIHNNSLLSGVYYLDTPPNAGNINFIKGYGEQEIFPSAISPNVSELDRVTCHEIQFEVKAGKLLIFPSNLMHAVRPNLSEKMRYSLAFNVFCRGDFGWREGQLTL